MPTTKSRKPRKKALPKKKLSNPLFSMMENLLVWIFPITAYLLNLFQRIDFLFERNVNVRGLNPTQKTALGVVLILISGLYFLHKALKNHAFERNLNQVYNSKTLDDRDPKNITIDSLNLNLGIEEGYIFDGFWSISRNKVTHLASSSDPGNKGAVVLYGHNKYSIFGQLGKLRKNDKIVIKTKNNDSFRYLVGDIQVVEPDRVDVLTTNKNSEVLIFYTCTGFADSKRLVVKAYPESLIHLQGYKLPN